jgi:hypothetical protein
MTRIGGWQARLPVVAAAIASAAGATWMPSISPIDGAMGSRSAREGLQAARGVVLCARTRAWSVGRSCV